MNATRPGCLLQSSTASSSTTATRPATWSPTTNAWRPCSKNPLILLTNKKISQVQEIMPTIEVAKRADRPLLVVAEDVDGPALQLLVGGNMHKTMQSVVVRAPGFGHRRVAELEDLAVALGGHVIAKDTGIELGEITTRTPRLV